MLRAHRAGLGLSTVTWRQLADRVENDRPDAVTVDVFETCVVRDLAGDEAIERTADRWSSAGGVKDRRSAEHIKAAAQLELDLCKPIPGAIESLDRIRAVVGSIVFISDTDRSSKLLIELLENHSIFRPGDRLVASCEAGVTKSRGGLYDLIWDAKPLVVWHVGNNDWADGVMAAAHGYEPFYLSTGNLSRYERALCSDNPNGMGPVLAAAARSVRMQLEHELESGVLDEHAFQLRRLGAQVAGPAMCAFGHWMAGEIKRHEIDRLGFLSRDGELPKLIADRFPDPALRAVPRSYVHLNRLSVTLATAAAIGVDTWVKEGTRGADDFLRARLHLASFKSVLQRLGFEPTDVGKVMGTSFALVDHDPAEPLSDAQADDWLALLNDQSARELVLQRATERRSTMVAYLDQLGFLSATQPAFVDVGWRGRLARLINTALGEYFPNEPIHLHFGGDRIPPDVTEPTRIHRFAFPGTEQIRPFDNPPAPVETITASGNPRVADYRRSEQGMIEPVLEEAITDVGRVDRAEMWHGAIAMVEALPDASRISSWDLSSDSLVGETREILRLWWYEPQRDEAAAMTGMAFEGDEAGAEVRPVLAPYALGDIVGGNRIARQWRQGSSAISPRSSQIGLRAAVAARKVLRKLRN